jgi:hypothetical protein
MIRNRQVPLFQSPPSIIPVPVDDPMPIVHLEELPIDPDPIPEPAQVQITNPGSKPKPKPKPVPQSKPKPKSSIANTSIAVSTHITCILVNFKTKRLTKQALTTFLDYYSSVHVILVDNGSHDDSTNLVRQAGKVYPGVTSVLYDTNIGHGPAMHNAIKQSTTDYVFTLDSDCIVQRVGFLEQMLERAQSGNLYAIGWRRWVDRLTGVPLEWHIEKPPAKKFIPYIHPCASLYNRRMYHQLYPFTHHGAPCIINMREATSKQFKMQSFPIFDYIKHLKAGTRRMYQGRWDPKTTDRPGPWNEDMDWPI